MFHLVSFLYDSSRHQLVLVEEFVGTAWAAFRPVHSLNDLDKPMVNYHIMGRLILFIIGAAALFRTVRSIIIEKSTYSRIFRETGGIESNVQQAVSYFVIQNGRRVDFESGHLEHRWSD
ncbi:hypothetical protein N431DRAFT_441949 [Stipitochalara longipes BDJ]|nr:hypothetical protein N431DRAFT_441949 [Stipitochalara longipes BDJ]